jgi:hypothetical protein
MEEDDAGPCHASRYAIEVAAGPALKFTPLSAIR